MTLRVLIASGTLAVAPDFDLLASTHRTYSHSIGAVAAVGFISWALIRARAANAAIAAIVTAAYASHLPLDWLSKDTRAPSGLMMLWPFSMTYYQSGWDVFSEISRRYWLPQEFILSNLKAATWEFSVMMPVVMVAWAWWSKRTLSRQSQVDSRKSTV